MNILILGSGVSGLTTGVRLLEAGHSVAIWTRDLPAQTTSSVAAAVWYPYKAYPEDKVTAWGAEAYRVFTTLAGVEGAGIRMAEVLELLSAPTPDPWWVAAVDGFRHAAPDELAAAGAGYRDGYVFAAPVIAMPVYLDYLARRFESLGGTITQRPIASLDEALAACSVVVNCTGLGARDLTGDTDLHPSRGQVLRIRPNGFQRCILDDTGPNAVAYIVPRLTDIVLGGTDDEGSAGTEPNPDVTADILRRCARLDPAFAAVSEADILSIAVGLRPVRSAVRLEVERPQPARQDRLVVHNYGHGGAGVTLSWGCAAEAVRLIHEHATAFPHSIHTNRTQP
jgi:D-amino-acid oxidase